MKQKYIIGVDISKSKIDCAIIDAHFKLEREREVANQDAKLRSFLRGALKSLKLHADELLVCIGVLKALCAYDEYGCGTLANVQLFDSFKKGSKIQTSCRNEHGRVI